jgi:proteasome lid subunit RPN8/RPN11
MTEDSRMKNDRDNDERKQVLKEESTEIKIGKPVVIKAEAYKTIILYASRYANQAIPSEDWKEIYGLLIGYYDDELLYVERAIPMTYGHDTDVEFSETDYGDVEKIHDELDKEGKGYFIVGWFHSHPGLTLFFSYIDLINQLGFQGKFSDAIGLVFDHTLLGKKREEKIDNNILTKYDTGFEIYRLTDVALDSNSVEFETNYHKVDYIVEGLNKFFFANVLAELSSLVSAGKPLQEAFKEQYKLESEYKDIDEVLEEPNIELSQNNLVDIPLSEDIKFNVDDIFYETIIDEDKIKEAADQFIYEGNQAFKNKDTFTGVEKYRQGIENYKEINDMDRVMDLLRKVSRSCIANNHLVIAREFADELFKVAEFNNQIFYRGIASYIIGYIIVREGDIDALEYGLKKIEEAAVDFIKVQDYAGAGMAFNKIGLSYEKKIKNIGQACLFYREAVENYNNGLVYSHPLRITSWSKPEVLIEKIIELRDIIDVLLPEIENSEIKKKVVHDLKSIRFNF